MPRATGLERGAAAAGSSSVATPIGNLGDLSPRARDVLATADLICCEDTRRTRALLSAVGHRRRGAGGDRLLSLHGHNEAARLEHVAAAVAPAARRWRWSATPGRPASRTPGAWLAARLAAAGETVSTVPGPSSVLGALVVSGLRPTASASRASCPARAPSAAAASPRSWPTSAPPWCSRHPGRVAATLAELAAADPHRPVAVVRELTKLHEEVWRGPLGEAAAAFAARPARGEVVLVDRRAPGRRPTGRGRGRGGRARCSGATTPRRAPAGGRARGGVARRATTARL